MNRSVVGHLNINSLPNKFDQLKLNETKLDSSFPDSQFIIGGFRQPYRLDRNKHGEGVMTFVREDISCKIISKHAFPDDIEGIFIEMNRGKTMVNAWDIPSPNPMTIFSNP